MSTMSRAPGIVAWAAMVLAMLLSSCHPLLNPVDPDSPAYEGIRTDPTGPESSLPEIISWQIFAEHDTGNWIPLEIPETGLFTEPRSGTLYDIVFTFADRVESDDFSEGLFVVGIVSGGSASVIQIGAPEVELIDGGRRMVYHLDTTTTTPSPTAPYQASVRIKLIDADGIVIGDRTIYFLTGDVDGDGEVTNEDSTGSAGVAPYVGQLAHPDSPGSVRADVDADGIVDSNDNGDVINVVGRSVSTIGTILM